MAKISVGIFGGSGYTGSELLRILLFHPDVDIRLVTANELRGKRVDEVHPNLLRLTDLVFRETDVTEEVNRLDCLFLALPHGESLKIVPRLNASPAVIDLAGDFRLKNESAYREFYGWEHPSFGLQPDFVYGLSEVNRESIRRSRRLANPGCFSTAILLGLYPLMKNRLVRGTIVADGKTGSSGSGNKARLGTHHPRRANSFFAYKPFRHQHVPEVLENLQTFNPSWNGDFIFQPHSAPLVRGVFVSLYVGLSRSLDAERMSDIYGNAYAGSPFIRIRQADGSPDVNWVKHTNFADIGWALEGRTAVIFTAIDNLVKGGAGQAVQNMNLMFGLEEQTGLIFPGSHP